MPLGLIGVALSPLHSAALCGQGGGPRDSRYTCATKSPRAGDHNKKAALAALGVAGDTNPHGHPSVPDDEGAAGDADPLGRPGVVPPCTLVL